MKLCPKYCAFILSAALVMASAIAIHHFATPRNLHAMRFAAIKSLAGKDAVIVNADFTPDGSFIVDMAVTDKGMFLENSRYLKMTIFTSNKEQDKAARDLIESLKRCCGNTVTESGKPPLSNCDRTKPGQHCYTEDAPGNSVTLDILPEK